MVGRIWRAFGPQPHREETFKLSTIPCLRQGAPHCRHNLHPLLKVLALCVDEKSQIQAWDRNQPLLPLSPGVPALRTHDLRTTRHDTTTLFAALYIATGKSSASWVGVTGPRILTVSAHDRHPRIA
jgi:hypothetical protein